MALHIRKNDMVEVIAGDHRGARGKVLRIDPKRHKVVVEGVNMVFRHVKPSRKNPRGGRLQKEAPLHISNVLPYDPAAGKGRRIRFVIEGDRRGRSAVKKRVTVGGTTLHTLTKARRTEG